MDAFTTAQTIELVSRIGTKKAYMRLDKLWWSSFMTGPLIGFGCSILLSTETAPWFQTNAPGLIRTIGALMFPIGLVMVVLSGFDLFTANIMYMTAAFLHRRVSVKDVAISWVVSFFGNLAGMLFFISIIIGYGGVLDDIPAFKTETVNFAVMKAQMPGWHQIFLKGIGANWLVCMAVFLSISSREIISKIIAIWFPTATFISLGLDHVVANMGFIPIGIWNGAPFGVGYYIWKSLIPTLLGNMIGGGLFVATMFWYLYLTGEEDVQLSFYGGPLNTAMAIGGPTASRHTNGVTTNGSSPDGHINEKDNIGGPTKDGHVHNDHLPHSGSPLTSGISHELGQEKYTKRKGQSTNGDTSAV